MKLKFCINKIKKINNDLLNKIKSKPKNLDIDFFHNKLLNNIIEINNFDNEVASLSNRIKGKKSINNIYPNLRKINSAIMRIPKTQRNHYTHDIINNKLIRSNNIFNKFKNNSIYLNNDFHKKIKNKSINEENKLLKSSKCDFPYDINSIVKKKSRNFSINKSQIKEDEKCNKINKYVNILEKKMKEKLKQITNFEDVNFYYRKVKMKNKSKNINNNNNKIINRMLFDIDKIHKSNKLSNNKIKKKNNNILTYKTTNIQQSTKNDSMSKTISTEKFQVKDLNKLSQYLKGQVKNYFIKNNFSSIKEYFNDWCLYKNENDYKKKYYLDTENIYYYLKHKIGLNIKKEDINKIFGNFHSCFDIESFKNYFFEENPGKESFIITKDLLLKKSKEELNYRMNNIFLPSYHYDSNKKNYCKSSLLFNALKEQKSIILDRICDFKFGKNNKNIEYDYKAFYNLINSLKIDKNLLETKNIKIIFIKYQNKNKKLNIKYFINILYGNDNIKKECLLNEDNKFNENIKSEKNNNSNLKNMKNNIKKSQNFISGNLNINKNNEDKYTNNYPINTNKNSEGSSDYMEVAIKSKKNIFKNKFKRKKNLSTSFLQKKIIFIKSSSNSSKNISKSKKKSFIKMFCDFDKNIKENNIPNNSINNSKSNELNSNYIEKKFFNKKKSNFKYKKGKKLKYLNYKTIKLHNKNILSRIKENSKLDDNERNYKIKRSLSSNLKRKKRKNQINKENSRSNLSNFEISKIFGEYRFQYLNSDIINLI